MISEFFIDRPKFAVVIAIVTSLVGAIGIIFIPIADYPNIAPPQVSVTAQYPGASAKVIQDTVATPIEQQVNGVDGMLYMTSTSDNSGNYVLTVNFRIGTDPDIAAVNVQNRVAMATALLPATVVQQGVITSKQSSNMIQVINLISPDQSRDELFLSNYAANHVQEPLSRIPGVGGTAQFGQLNYSMRVWLDTDKLTYLDLTASDVVEAIEAQNVQATAGTVGAPPFGDGRVDFQYTLQAEGLLDTVDQFEKIIVQANTDGSLVRLSDVARVQLGSETYDSNATFNNTPAAAIQILLESGANALDVADGVYEQMDELAKSFPEGVAYNLTYDVTKAVRASVREVLQTLGITALLVIAVTFMFLLSWRATIIPAIAIPVSLLGAVALIYLIGFSANMITLFAIILAITLVVDDAIVIIENAERIMEEEELEPREATLKAMSQITGPIIATTFVLAAVFVPVCFFPGITGKIYLEFALTIVFAFSLSAVNALTLGPALCSLLLKRSTGHAKGPLRAIPWTVDRLRRGYMWLTFRMLRYAGVTLVIFACFIGATVYLFQATPTGFIPQEDQGVLMSSITLPDGASLQRTEEVISQLSDITAKTPGVLNVIGVSGDSLINGTRPNTGMIVAVLKDWSERTTPETQWYSILATLDSEFNALPSATAVVFPLPTIQGVGSSGGTSAELLDLNTGSLQQLDSVQRAFLTALNATPEYKQAFGNFSATTPQYYLAIDRDRAQTLGVDISNIYEVLQANLGEYYVNNFVVDGNIYWVVLTAESRFRHSVGDVRDIYVRNDSNEMIPLSALVTESPILGTDQIYRYNLFQASSITGLLEPGVASGEGIRIMEEVAAKTLPDGYRIDWSGVTLQEVQAGGLVVYILILAVIFAYLFLVAQYESWTLPMSVMTSTVMSVFGALLPLYFLSSLNNNIYAQIGLVLLIALAAKKAIMIVEFAKVRRDEGASIAHAALSAAKLRFRPVTMTGLCFVIGVLPLIFASGPGASARLSIGVPVFAGMLVDSTLGLLMVPVLYFVFQSMREKANNWRRRRNRSEQTWTEQGAE